MAASGLGGGSYGYAGEWTDSSGLQYLRARYYSPATGRFISKDPFPGLQSQPASLTPYVYALNNPVLYSDPSGEFVPILAIAGLGFAAGAIINTYQQTNGFSSFCDFDIVEALAWGVGGAAAATSFTIMAVSGVGLIGMGIQGVALGLSSIGISASVSTSVFIAGSTAWGWSSTAMIWLSTGNNYPKLVIDSAKMPNIARNIRNAQAKGAPQILTRTQDPTRIVSNRRTACAGFCGVGSPDEYPFATTYEGGKGAFVSGVPLQEQRIQGGTLHQFYEQFNIKDGDKFRVIVR